MSTADQYLHVPNALLGLGRRSWRRSHIRLILDHYRWDYHEITKTKPNLMHELDLLVQEYDLGPADRRSILNARFSGQTPERRSRVRRVPHPTFPPVEVVGRRHSSQLQTKTKKTVARKARKNIVTTAPTSAVVTSPRDCVVCFETLTVENTPKRKITTSCDHEPDVCTTCLSTSISTQITGKVWDQISCPTCGERLGYHDVQEFADSGVFGRYDFHSLQSCLSDGQFQRCRHPKCDSGQQCFPDKDSYMICVACKGRTCITCDTIWHPSETCQEIAAIRAKARDAEAAATTKYLTKNVKECPRCNVRGEKASGCDHMTCPRCKVQYCWLCLADYREIGRIGNTAHQKDCRHHSNNLPNVPT